MKMGMNKDYNNKEPEHIFNVQTHLKNKNIKFRVIDDAHKLCFVSVQLLLDDYLLQMKLVHFL